MNSSTSSFRTELRVLAVVLVAWTAAESFFPLMGTRFSRDLREIGGLHRKVRQGCATEDLSALVLGNSLSLHGFDRAVIQAAAPAGFGVPVKFTFVAFEGAFMTETFRIYKHYVEPTPEPPKVLIVPFAQTGLADQSGVEIERMVYHCDWSDVHEVLKDEVGLGQLCEFLHCYLSQAFANRFRVRQFVFERLLPDYRESEIRLRSANRPPAAGSSAKRAWTYDKLDRMLDLCSRRGIRVAILAMPIQSHYDVPPQVLDIIARYDMDLLDMRDTPGLDAGKFSDATHLNPAGAEVFSAIFVDRFARYLAARKLNGKRNLATVQ
ncbi:MAG: hypothetical protein ABSG86_11530 [Thermoguttaceae bacterium]|jgi:hypothetical protein